MYIREFTEVDHAQVAGWWLAHKWPVIPLPSLPKNGLIVVGDDGREVCAGFIYQTDSDIAWLEFIVSNPECSMRVRAKSLDTLIAGLKARAQELGHRCFFTSLSSKGLMKLYEKHGFQRTDTKMTNFIGRS